MRSAGAYFLDLMQGKYNPYKERFAWWTHPWLLLLLGGEVVLIVFSFVFAYTIVDLVSGIVLGLFFCVLPFLTLRYFKNVLIDPNYSIDKNVIASTNLELSQSRKQAQEEFERIELAMLKEGKKIPVLEKLRIDEARRKIHPWYGAIEVMEVDPVSREVFIRVQTGRFEATEAKSIAGRRFVRLAASFLTSISREQQFALLLPFFDSLVFEAYSLYEDEQGRDTPFPVLSSQFKKDDLPLLKGSANIDVLRRVGDLRFADGERVEPHHGIGPSIVRGGK